LITQKWGAVFFAEPAVVVVTVVDARSIRPVVVSGVDVSSPEEHELATNATTASHFQLRFCMKKPPGARCYGESPTIWRQEADAQ
jgi:hypothetical protein